MTLPGGVGGLAGSRPEVAVADRIRALEARLTRLEAARPLLLDEVTASAAVPATPAALTGVLSATATVPSGFTTAVVLMTVTYTAAGSGTLSIRASAGARSATTVPTSSTLARQVFITTLTDLNGAAQFTLTASVASVGSWGAGVAYLSATILYLR